MIDAKNFFDQLVKNDERTYDNIQKITNGQGDDYTVSCLLYYPHLKKHNEMISKYLDKQKELDFDPKAIQQINYTANLDRAGYTIMLLILQEVKETILYFSQRTVKLL